MEKKMFIMNVQKQTKEMTFQIYFQITKKAMLP